MADALRAHSAPPLQTHTRVEELRAGRHIGSATRDTPLASLRGTHALVGDRSAALNRPKLRRLFHARLGVALLAFVGVGQSVHATIPMIHKRRC